MTPPPHETKPFSKNCKEESHRTKDCTQITEVLGEGEELNKYQKAYQELRQRDPIASMDETAMEYPSQDYRQLNQLLEERRHLGQQIPRRELDKKKYQPRMLTGPNEIELGLPRTAWTPHRDSDLPGIYPIPEDEGKGRSNR